jgi:hypothetical protein
MPLRALAPLLVAAIVLAAPEIGADEQIWLELRAPESGAAVTGPIGLLEVEGWAGATSEDRHELIIAIDVSASTGLPSGADVNENGKVGRTLRSSRDPQRNRNPRRQCTDPGDTVLAAEIAGARQLVEHLDPKRTRTGIVIFSSRARLIAPISSSRQALGAALDDLASEVVPFGSTNIAAALRTATRAFADTEAPAGQKPHRSVILLSDGWPLGDGALERSLSETLDAARQATENGVKIHTFAIGADTMEGIDVYRRISAGSGGHFVAVEKPSEISLCLSHLQLTQPIRIALANSTTGEAGRAVRQFADGSFDGIVSLVPGENRISVEARGPGGALRALERVVIFQRSDPTDAAEARAAREKLARLRRRTMETDLALEVTRGRGEEQDKQLDLLLDAGSE